MQDKLKKDSLLTSTESLALTNIRHIIKGSKMTQRALAEKLGESTANLSKLLSDSQRPLKVSDLHHLAKALGVKVDLLFKPDLVSKGVKKLSEEERLLDLIETSPDDIDLEKVITFLREIPDTTQRKYIFDILFYAANIKAFRHHLISFLLDYQISNEKAFQKFENKTKARS